MADRPQIVTNLLELSKYYGKVFPRLDYRTKCEAIDEAYHMEMHRGVKEQVEQEEATTEDGFGRTYTDTDLPIVRAQAVAEIPFHVDLFTSEFPIFSVDKSKLPSAATPLATAINNKLGKDQTKYRWELEINKFLKSAIKYNLAALECSWDTTNVPVRKREQEAAASLKTSKETYSGIKLKCPNTYNIFWDTAVDPSEVYSKGEFAGYTEPMTRVALWELKRHLENLKEVDTDSVIYINGGDELWKSQSTNCGDFGYHIPDLGKSGMETRQQDWMAEVGGINTPGHSDVKFPGKVYNVSTLYLRVIPSDVDTFLEPKDVPTILKLHLVNGEHVLAIERINHPLGYIPMFFTTPELDCMGSQGKSGLECTVNLQKLATEFMTKRLDSIEEGIDGTLILDTRYLDISQLQSKKIAVPKSNFGASQKALRDLAYRLEHRDVTTNILAQDIPFVMSLAERTNLTNNTIQGQFQKGNKTPDEFRQTLANAEAPQLERAGQIEVQVFSPLKAFIKWFLITKVEDAPVEINGEMTSQDLTQLTDDTFDFKLAGGLDPLTIAMKQGALAELFQLAQTNPLLSQRYDIVGLFNDLYYARGLDISKYAVPIPQQDAEGTAGGSKPTNDGAPENPSS